MSWWQAIILGVVEGLTEYLPVSSTGHLILAAWMLGLTEDPALKAAVDRFNIVIQAGAIAAVAGLYWGRIKQMIAGFAGRNPQGLRLAINLILAFLPAAVLGPLLAGTIDEHLFEPWPVIGALFAGAWLMLIVAKNRTMSGSKHGGRDLDHIDARMALLIGFAQCVAMWPGTSRSMMTIVAALLLGLRAKAAAEFSFLLGLITLSAATGYAGMKGGGDMISELGSGSMTQGWIILAIGFVAATISAAVAVKWFVGFLTKHGLAPFGWYRLALAIALGVLIWTGVMQWSDPVVESADGAEPATAVEPGG
jgi:undecaprenyl-diphosphatase